MENRNALIAIALSAIVSSACTAAAIKFSTNDPSGAQDLNSVRDIQSQIEELENNLALESQARQSLQQQVANYQLSVKQGKNILEPDSNEQIVSQQAQTAPIQSQQEVIQEFRERRRAERLASQQPDYRRNQLIEAGFAAEEAARIVQIESEQSLNQLQAQYDFRRERAAEDVRSLADTNPIRAELGDQNYERYLEANGLPTSAQIGSVINGSPGANAGLRAGDNITAYAGERVFNLNDINYLTVRGNVGESVLVEVDRDGNSVQLTIPRGPIGISDGGRRRFRR